MLADRLGFGPLATEGALVGALAARARPTGEGPSG
jgi:hypothetical protein